jgi:PDZ domain/Aspartyl protease
MNAGEEHMKVYSRRQLLSGLLPLLLSRARRQQTRSFLGKSFKHTAQVTICALMAAVVIALQAARVTAAEQTARLPLLDEDAMIRVPVTLFGETHYFTVDTGSPVSIIDASYRARLVAPLELGSPDISMFETDTPALYRCPDLSVGGIRADLQEVGCVDLGMMKRITGEQCDGILGMDFLQNYVVSMDFDKQTLTIGGRVPEDATKGAARIPLTRMANNRVGVPAVLNKTLSLVLLIDSANTSSVCLSKANWNKLGNPQARTQRLLVAMIENPVSESLRLRLCEMQVASDVYPDLLCLLWPREDAISDLLGLAFLRRHVATIDFPNKILYLRPGQHFRDADETDMSGLHLLRDGERTFVHSVDEGSPAAVAGMKAGDVLVRLNGESISAKRMRDIRQQLKAKDGAEATLELRRNEHSLKVVFQLKKVL